ncbi:ornithine cyclodeaminase [Methylosarcina fibrata]|uniref:ornithine cyclodeaminase n=1 Tax=Methylosarcina fibrata TaxID=105972 RepID=UPI000364AE64|nr:ornithine cyclodeaminase [Methylosarcina fibrata]
MKLLTVTDIRELVHIIGLEKFFDRIVLALEEDFGRWHEFNLSPRHATHYPHGVIELMPCSDNSLYAFKYVNGHPGNTLKDKLSVIAVGQLSEVEAGYPLMICDMTLLTAFRTAATGVLAARYLARHDAASLAIIGTGAQAEFQAIGFSRFFGLNSIRFYDCDSRAMAKFSANLKRQRWALMPCRSIIEAVSRADIVITATAAKKRQSLFEIGDIAAGTHIHAMGGDCPGKTEFSENLLRQVKLVVEYMPQSLQEGEAQQVGPGQVHAELWELIAGKKAGRENAEEITLFDSVGFALEDYSILRVVYELASVYRLGTELSMLPEPEDPKNLFGLLDF